jgi:chemotaxis response regulator CheB
MGNAKIMYAPQPISCLNQLLNVYAERLIAVVLSGSGKDGKEGMVVVKQMVG